MQDFQPERRLARGALLVMVVVSLAALVAGCGKSSGNTANSASSPPRGAVATEDSPAGDIPDNQAFVAYQSPAGYTIQIPEGWARQENGDQVTFADKLNSVAIGVSQATAAPTVDSATATDVPALKRQVEAFDQVAVKAVDLPSGKAILIRYRANSAPDAVTGKQTRLEVDRYETFKDGKLAVISLAAPAGSDNVDAWNQIARSFTWS